MTSWLHPHLSVGKGRTPFLTSYRSGPATHSSDDPEQESSWPWPQHPLMYNESLDELQAPSSSELEGATALGAADSDTQSPS